MTETAVPNLQLFNSRKKQVQMKQSSQSFRNTMKQNLNSPYNLIKNTQFFQKTKNMYPISNKHHVSSTVTPIHLNYPPCAFQRDFMRVPVDPLLIPPPLYPLYDPLYIPPPATYLYMADQVLMGRSRAKGNSKQTKHASPTQNYNKTTGRFVKRDCSCEIDHKNQKNIVNRPYIQNKKVTSKPIMKETKKDPQIPSDTYKSITKDVYLIGKQAHNKNKNNNNKSKDDQKKENTSFILQNQKNLVTHQSIILNTISRHQTPFDGKRKNDNEKQKQTKPFKIQLALPPKKDLVSTHCQTLKEAPNPIEINRSSFLIEKMVRKIPDMLDAQTFRRLLKQQDEQLKKIKIQISQDQYQIDLQDLIDSKDDYIQQSKDILVTLNELSQDKTEFALVNRLLGFAKKKQGVIWPQV